MQGMRMLMGLACLMALVACERGVDDLRDWMEQERQRPGEPIDPVPPLIAAEIVAYEALELRDPFQRQPGRSQADDSAARAGHGLRPDPDRRREFLEGFPIDTLRMVGTIRIEEVDYALVRDNENIVHRVRAGNYMGSHHGRVERVTANRIEIRELVPDGRGGWSERRIQIVMDERT